MKMLVPAAALALLVASSARAQAQESASGASPGLSVSGGLTLLSDYRFRGLSRSDGDPALQGQLTLSLPSGLYGGARGTTLKGLASRADVELDLYAGYNADLGLGTSLDAGLIYYAFPGGRGRTGYFEPYASVSHTLGPVEGTIGAKYAPQQRALGNEDVLYLFGQVEGGIPMTPLTLFAEAGRQDAGAFGRYWNWSLGGRYRLGPVEAGLRYVDTDLPSRPGGKAGLVASLGLRF